MLKYQFGAISQLAAFACILLDIVPNHMSIAGRLNRWWFDVLENGPSSYYAHYFDVDWVGDDRIVLPVLTERYGRALQSGAIQLVTAPATRPGRTGKLAVRAGDLELPLSPGSLGILVRRAADHIDHAELAFIGDALVELAEALGAPVIDWHGRQNFPNTHPLAVFGSDVLRKAMGKKDPKVMAKQREAFMTGALAKGISEKKASKIFELMEFFAGYGFNKSHSTAYAFLAYQTAYLKTYFPNQYMAALLTYESAARKVEEWVPYLEDCRQTLFPDHTAQKPHLGVEGQKRYWRILVGVGMRQGAAHGGHVAYAHGGHAAKGVGQHRQPQRATLVDQQRHERSRGKPEGAANRARGADARNEHPANGGRWHAAQP